MANAKIETVSKPVSTVVEEKVYTLTLNEEEAKSLKALAGSVVGGEADTYNRDTFAIWDALFYAGVPSTPARDRFTVSASRIIAKAL